MSTLYVREVPEAVYGELRRRASDHRTSIAQEAIRLLERALRVDPSGLEEFLDELEPRRFQVSLEAPSAAELIRQDRDARGGGLVFDDEDK
ncbi:MAG: hypothetical protein VCC00_03640 [Deltaproteobacteria bacterium]